MHPTQTGPVEGTISTFKCPRVRQLKQCATIRRSSILNLPFAKETDEADGECEGEPVPVVGGSQFCYVPQHLVRVRSSSRPQILCDDRFYGGLVCMASDNQFAAASLPDAASAPPVAAGPPLPDAASALPEAGKASTSMGCSQAGCRSSCCNFRRAPLDHAFHAPAFCLWAQAASWVCSIKSKLKGVAGRAGYHVKLPRAGPFRTP